MKDNVLVIRVGDDGAKELCTADVEMMGDECTIDEESVEPIDLTKLSLRERAIAELVLDAMGGGDSEAEIDSAELRRKIPAKMRQLRRRKSLN
jgi:hypothetical protein